MLYSSLTIFYNFCKRSCPITVCLSVCQSATKKTRVILFFFISYLDYYIVNQTTNLEKCEQAGVTFFIELSSGNKKNIIIKLFEPSERRKYVFCGLKIADIVAGTISASVFALVLRYMQNQYSYRNFIF